MIEREKVIKGLKCCVHNYMGDCDNCPYNDDSRCCDTKLMCDAITLLKAQELCEDAVSREAVINITAETGALETQVRVKQLPSVQPMHVPRVMKIGEVRNWVHSDRTTREPIFIEMRSGVCAWIIDDEVREIPGAENLTSDLYSKTWRCWTSRPTEEQREAIPWQS